MKSQQDVPASKAIESLTNSIAQKRKAAQMKSQTEVTQRQHMCSKIVTHCRNAMGMPDTHEPVTANQAVEKVLSVTELPTPSLATTKSFHIIPPNAKMTKAICFLTRVWVVWDGFGFGSCHLNG